MIKKRLFFSLGAALLCAAILVSQSPSELLQKGIYLQETVGDLDSAIKLYRQVIQMAKESRDNAAQAQYRLGLCLLKKDQQAEAAKTFQQIIEMYPEQTDLVNKARAALHAPPKLLPAPWKEGEVLEFATKMGNMKMPGANSLRMLYSVRRSKKDSNRLVLESRLTTPAMLSSDRVEVDPETMLPFSSSSQNPMFDGAQIAYGKSEAQFTFKSKPPRAVPLSGEVFDLTELQALLRRLPLAAGYKSQLAILTAQSGEVSTLSIAVAGEEDVETPAGKFHCYRVNAGGAGNSSYWIAVNAPRYLVKFETGFMSNTLEAVLHAGPEVQQFHNDTLGFSGTLPAGWISGKAEYLPLAKGGEMLQFVSPDSQAVVTLTVEPVGFLKDPKPEDTRREAEARASFLPGNKVRAGSWETSRLSGHPALSWLVDAPDIMSQEPIVEYNVWIRSAASQAKFYAKVSAAEFEQFKPTLDQIVQSLIVK